MRRRTPNSWALGLGALALSGSVSSPSAALGASGMRAELRCRPEAAPGRVLCELKVAPLAGFRLVWGDALVTSAPEFAPPLRARVSPERYGAAEAGERTLTLAFVASQVGVGEVSVSARGVVCRGHAGEERCHAERVRVKAELRVGSR